MERGSNWKQGQAIRSAAALTLAVAGCLLGAAPSADAAKLRVERFPTLNPFDELTYVAAPSERNALVIEPAVGYTNALKITDRGCGGTCPITIEEPPPPRSGSGCFHVNVAPRHVICTEVDSIKSVDLGAGQDSATVTASLMFRLDGGPGDDVLTYNQVDNPRAPSYIRGADLHGGDGNDTLLGGKLGDELHGQAGVDRLFGRGGDDVLHPDAAAIHAGETLSGGSGSDEVAYELREGPVRLDLDGVADDGAVDAAGQPIENDSILADVESLTGGRADDTLVGNAGPNRLSGGPGRDVLDAHGGPDHLRGGDHQDELRGGEGDDVVIGDNGDDALWGGGGKDYLIGDGGQPGFYDGDDVMDGGPGADTLLGDAGADTLWEGDTDAAPSPDQLDGGPGWDAAGYGPSRRSQLTISLDGQANDGATGERDLLLDVSIVHGGSGNDTITGDELGNYLHGYAGDDKLVGHAGRDRFFAAAGNDWLLAADRQLDEVVDCSDGDDRAEVDSLDEAGMSGCERVSRP